jgi:hypothetical protein
LAPEENHAVFADYKQLHPLGFWIFARVSSYPLGGTAGQLPGLLGTP